ncbi:hypothetical protein U1Q18_014666, partial [Sarracenia purpurea var. burkii]
NTGCPANTKDLKVDFSASFNHVFLFESDKTSLILLMEDRELLLAIRSKNENSQGPCNDGTVKKTEGINIRTTGVNIFVFAGSDNPACFFEGA